MSSYTVERLCSESRHRLNRSPHEGGQAPRQARGARLPHAAPGHHLIRGAGGLVIAAPRRGPPLLACSRAIFSADSLVLLYIQPFSHLELNIRQVCDYMLSCNATITRSDALVCPQVGTWMTSTRKRRLYRITTGRSKPQTIFKRRVLAQRTRLGDSSAACSCASSSPWRQIRASCSLFSTNADEKAFDFRGISIQYPAVLAAYCVSLYHCYCAIAVVVDGEISIHSTPFSPSSIYVCTCTHVESSVCILSFLLALLQIHVLLHF